jgi:membrane carboxypeptidase/penicillin-binding protein
MIKKFLEWILAHKKIVFIYIPLIILFFFILYALFIYSSWLGDKEGAMNKLSQYKMLIDRTEEMSQGSFSDIDLKAKVVDIPTRIYDRNNQIIGEFFEQKREIVPYGSIPAWLVKAVIASEDRNFYKHRGISLAGIVRAMAVNILHLHVVQGGSTITQQLAKVLFTDMERSIKRKIYEAFCALEIEKHYDKQDILSMYLNLIYFGNGAYGVESTAKMFFGASVKDLNETECAMIVAAISNPLVYSPLSNLSSAIVKTRRIMMSMEDAGYIKKERSEYQFSRFLKKWDIVFDNNGKAVSSLIGSFILSSYRVNKAPLFNEQIRGCS